MGSETITHATLCELSKAGAIREAAAVGRNNCWVVVVKYGDAEKTLVGRNSRQARTWVNLNSVAKYLAGLGIYEFVTNTHDYNPEQKKTLKRPDKAEALKRAHQAAEYDKWFREQVQAAIEEADSPDARWLTSETLFDGLERRLEKRYGKRPE